ncbi:MAG: hypothetical protein DRP42_01820 [Tenericutes bacterium]|nr:MAG: hypothetical protein DRP42_01820 [Mycoplasmatota bacterium]
MFKMISKAFNVDVVPMKTLNSKTANQRKVGIVAGNRKQAKKALEMLKEKFDNVEIVLTGQGYYIEITAKGISKYSAAKFLAKDLGFELSESMAIGDSMNDAMLFKHVGVSVAMANSMKELFPLSTHQTDSVKKSGVSRAINSLIKKR